MRFLRAAVASLVFVATPAIAESDADPGLAAPMTNARLEQLIRRLDPKATGRPGFWQLTVEERAVLVITDETADRMRIMTPVARAGELPADVLRRLLQSNFDTALDARYAIAQDMLWSAFIRPLGSLQDAEFLAGVGQVVNLALSYGTTYSSGLLMFRGGDSGEIQRRELIDRLLEKGREP